MRTFKITLTEEEVKAIIAYYAEKLLIRHNDEIEPTIEVTARMHDLNKRLNREEKPEIENSEGSSILETPPANIWPT